MASGAPPDWHGGTTASSLDVDAAVKELSAFPSPEQPPKKEAQEKSPSSAPPSAPPALTSKPIQEVKIGRVAAPLEILRHGSTREQTYNTRYRMMCAKLNQEATYICTASEDRSCRIFDASSRKQTIILLHSQLVRHASWSNDAAHVVTCCDDNFARIYKVDAENGDAKQRSICNLEHSNWVNSALFCKGDKVLITTSKERSVKIWLIDEGYGEGICQAEDTIMKWKHSDPVLHASMSSDNKYVCSASGAQRFFGVAKVFAMDADKNRDLLGWIQDDPVAVIEHEDAVTTANFSPDVSLLCTSCLDGTVKLFDTKRFDQVGLFKHKNWVTCAAFSADGRLIGTACEDGIVRIFEVSTRKEFQRFSCIDPVTWIDWSRDGSMILASSTQGAITFCPVNQSGT